MFFGRPNKASRAVICGVGVPPAWLSIGVDPACWFYYGQKSQDELQNNDLE